MSYDPTGVRPRDGEAVEEAMGAGRGAPAREPRVRKSPLTNARAANRPLRIPTMRKSPLTNTRAPSRPLRIAPPLARTQPRPAPTARHRAPPRPPFSDVVHRECAQQRRAIRRVRDTLRDSHLRNGSDRLCVLTRAGGVRWRCVTV